MNTKNCKKLLSKVLSLFLTVTVFFTLFNMISSAETYPYYGKLNGTNVNVRKGNDTSYAVVTQVTQGDVVKVLSVTTNSKGEKWLNINYDLTDLSLSGYVLAEYVDFYKAVSSGTDKEFEEYLTQQKFPESYKPYLRTLHQLYPEWVFKADHTGLTWSEVYKAQREVGKSLVSGSKDDSWKSMYSGAYDWSENKYVEFDSGGWVNASYRVIQHYIDPRNFLNTDSIFQFVSHEYDSSQTAKNVKKMVKGTFLDADFTESTRYDTYSDLLVYAGKQSGVSPYVLASMILVEQGTKGTGGSISGKVSGYKGYYNYFNIGAYKTSTMSAVQRGLWWAKGAGTGATTYKRPWNTKARSVVGGALWYADNYVEDGQNTLYYKKFNVVNKAAGLYNHQYMTNIQGADTEARVLKKAYVDILDSKFVFNIPVYTGMPSTPYTLPSKSGANNFFLKSLKVSGYSITPTFNKYTYSYSLIVPNDVETVTVSATGIQSTTTVSGAGKKALQEGTNTFIIKAKSQSGYSNNYTLKITRKTAMGDTPTVTSSSYNIGDYITGVSPQTSVASFMQGLTVKNGSLELTASSDKVKSSGYVFTGDKLRLKADSAVKKTYPVIIKGDVSGDGKITILDLAKVQKHILSVTSLKGVYQKAADTNSDSHINIIDLARVQKHILGVSDIKQ